MERVKVFNESGPIPSNVEVALCVPDINIPQLLATLRSDIAVGAQNCGINTGGGAYTGETGSHQLKAIGCVWTIVGHSERREGFGMAGETVEVCAKKCKVAIDNGLKVMFVSIISCFLLFADEPEVIRPNEKINFKYFSHHYYFYFPSCIFFSTLILQAIGEKKEEREAGTTMEVCASQLVPLAKELTAEDWASVAIAYEPVWAIGTGLTATPEMAQETHKQIRDWIANNVSPEIAKATRIQYGGSMKGANAEGLLAQPDIDGGLIGGASLKPDFFNVVNGIPKK